MIWAVLLLGLLLAGAGGWIGYRHLTRGRLQLVLDQAEVAPGSAFSGVLELELKRDLKAGPLTLDLVGEVQITEFNGGQRRMERIERFRDSQTLARADLYPAGFSGLFPFQGLLPRQVQKPEDAERALLFGSQYERLHWYLEARLGDDAKLVTRQRLKLVRGKRRPLADAE